MNIVAVQFDIAWEDKRANHATIERLLDDADVEPGSFVLLPELADTGFSLNVPAIVSDESLAWAQAVARRFNVYLQHGFAEIGPDGRGLNCAAMVDPTGRVMARYHKVHPFSYGKESAHYSGGNRLVLARCSGAVCCPVICYDLRFPELWRLAATHAQAPAEVFTIGACWPSTRQHHWRSLVIARAIENQAYVVAVNRIGADPHVQYAGGSLIVSPRGSVLAEAGATEQVITATLDMDMLRRWRAEFPALRDVHVDMLGHIETITAS